MAERDTLVEPQPLAEPLPRRSRTWRKWLTKIVAGVFLGLLLLLATVALILDTAPGHRFIVDQIAALNPRSGLKIWCGCQDAPCGRELRA